MGRRVEYWFQRCLIAAVVETTVTPIACLSSPQHTQYIQSKICDNPYPNRNSNVYFNAALLCRLRPIWIASQPGPDEIVMPVKRTTHLYPIPAWSHDWCVWRHTGYCLSKSRDALVHCWQLHYVTWHKSHPHPTSSAVAQRFIAIPNYDLSLLSY